MALNYIRPPADYYPSFTQGRPIFNGSIYVGEPGTDPVIPANQKQVTIRQEDGTEIPVSQPIATSSGGVPIYQGARVDLLVDGNYSQKVLDSQGSQVYYLEDALNGDPITIDELYSLTDARYSAVFGSVAEMIALNPIDGVAYVPVSGQLVKTTSYYTSIPYTEPQGGGGEYRVMTLAEYGVTPDEIGAAFTAGAFVFVRIFGFGIDLRDFGAKLDGVTDDTPSLTAAFANGPNAIKVPWTSGGLYYNSDIEMPEGVSFVGEAQPAFNNTGGHVGTTLKPGPNVVKGIFSDTTKGIAIRNFLIDMSATNDANSPAGITLAGTWYYDLDNIMVVNMQGDNSKGVHLVYSSATSTGHYWAFVKNLIVIGETAGVDANKAGTALLIEGDGASDRVNQISFHNIRCNRCNYGIDMDGAGGGLVFSAATAEANKADGVRIQNHSANVYPIFLGGEFGTNGGYGLNGPCLAINSAGQGNGTAKTGNGAAEQVLEASGSVTVFGNRLKGQSFIEGYTKQTITAATDTIAADAGVKVIEGDAPYTLSSNPQIEAGSRGQLITLIGTDNTNSITLSTGNGLRLRSGSIEIKQNTSITLQYFDNVGESHINNLWVEVARTQKSPTYTTATFSTDRAISNSATITTQELGDVLSTLIEDLQSRGILGG